MINDTYKPIFLSNSSSGADCFNMPPKTRQSLNFKLIEVVGLGKEFIPSEVPTLRSAISRGILLQEENDQNG